MKVGVHVFNFPWVGIMGLAFQEGNLWFLAQLMSSGEYVEESGVRPGLRPAQNLLWEQRLTHLWPWLGGAWINWVKTRGLSLRLTEDGRHLVDCTLRSNLG